MASPLPTVLRLALPALLAACAASGASATADARAAVPGPVVALSAARPGSDEHAVAQALQRWYTALSSGDWPALADHFWEHAIFAAVWAPPGEDGKRVVVETVPDFIAQAPEGPGSRAIFEEWILGGEVRVHGDVAQAWVLFGARFGDPGDLREWSGIDAFTLLRQGGEWRIITLSWAADH